MTLPSRSELEFKVVGVLKDMTEDWDLDLPDGINAQTSLVEDLAFESIDIVQFAVSVEQAFDRKGLPFEKLFMEDGDYVDDMRVSQVVDFLGKELS